MFLKFDHNVPKITKNGFSDDLEGIASTILKLKR
jgi:hypothetical protein